MLQRFRGIIASAIFASILVVAGTTAAHAATCQFTGGFQTIHDQIPTIVGNCLDDEYYSGNGNGYQHTAGPSGQGGLLVWDKATNIASYTDGYHTWVLGPFGLQERLNTQHFPWETATATAPKPALSRNWAGYEATSGTFTSVRGTWTEPTPVAGSAPGGMAIWVGIGGATNSDLIQAGTDEAQAATGRVIAKAWIETLPQPAQTIPLTVSPGDSITTSVSQQSSGSWLVQISNNTTGQSYQQTISYNSSLSSAEWIVETPVIGRRLLPLESFGAVPFSNGSVTQSGTTETIAQSGGSPVELVRGFGQVIASPSALGSDGASFSVSRQNGSTVPTVDPGEQFHVPASFRF